MYTTEENAWNHEVQMEKDRLIREGISPWDAFDKAIKNINSRRKREAHKRLDDAIKGIGGNRASKTVIAYKQITGDDLPED